MCVCVCVCVCVYLCVCVSCLPGLLLFLCTAIMPTLSHTRTLFFALPTPPPPLCFSAHRYLASGSEDQAAFVYDIRQGSVLSKLGRHGSVVTDVSWYY